MKNLTVFFLLFSMCCVLAPIQSTQGFPGLGELEKVVEKIFDKGIERIEAKIDVFVQEEVKKIRNEIILAYIVVIIISLMYSTGLILWLKRT